MRTQERQFDDRVVITYQSRVSAREHRICVPVEQCAEQIEFHKRHGHIVAVCPLSVCESQEHC